MQVPLYPVCTLSAAIFENRPSVQQSLRTYKDFVRVVTCGTIGYNKSMRNKQNDELAVCGLSAVKKLEKKDWKKIRRLYFTKENITVENDSENIDFDNIDFDIDILDMELYYREKDWQE